MGGNPLKQVGNAMGSVVTGGIANNVFGGGNPINDAVRGVGNDLVNAATLGQVGNAFGGGLVGNMLSGGKNEAPMTNDQLLAAQEAARIAKTNEYNNQLKASTSNARSKELGGLSETANSLSGANRSIYDHITGTNSDIQRILSGAKDSSQNRAYRDFDATNGYDSHQQWDSSPNLEGIKPIQSSVIAPTYQSTSTKGVNTAPAPAMQDTEFQGYQTALNNAGYRLQGLSRQNGDLSNERAMMDSRLGRVEGQAQQYSDVFAPSSTKGQTSSTKGAN